jgi:parvulin-like peptidyl-prolyl isomerase
MLRRYAMLIAGLLVFAPWARPAYSVRQEAKETPATPAAAANPVVVKVQGEAVTEKQVLNSIAQLAMQLAAQQQATPEQMQQKDTVFYKEALDTVIGTVLLKSEAREKGLVADKAKVDEALRSLKARIGDEAKFQQALQQNGMTEADVRNSIETELLCQQMLDQIAKDLPPPTDAEIRKYYDDNLKSFDQPEQRHAAAISLKVEKTATPEEKAAVRQRLENIRAEIESGKTTFAQAAIKESDDKANSARGGDIGFVRRGVMLKSLEDAVFSTPVGSLTGILESDMGFHLLQVIEVRSAGFAPSATAIPKIRDLLALKAKQEATKKHLAELRAKAKIEIVMSDEEWNKRHAAK